MLDGRSNLLTWRQRNRLSAWGSSERVDIDVNRHESFEFLNIFCTFASPIYFLPFKSSILVNLPF